MRSCTKCGRCLDVDKFASGTNWKWCKECKAQDVLIRNYRTKNPEILEKWNPQEFTWFRDYLKHRDYRRRMLQVTSKVPRLKQPPVDWHLRACWAAVLLANAEKLKVIGEQQRAAAHRASRDRWNAKRRAARVSNPQLERAKDQAKRAKNPELYKALDKLSSAKRRGATRTRNIPLNLTWEKNGGICSICQEPCDKDWWHLDHIVPLSKGGTHTFDNVAPAHPYCNLHKGNRDNDTIDIKWLHATRLAWEASEAAVRLRTGAAPPCGTDQRYSKGCRCEGCRAAHRIAGRERAQRKRKRDKEGGKIKSGRKAPASTINIEAGRAYAQLRKQDILSTVAAREAGLTMVERKWMEEGHKFR